MDRKRTFGLLALLASLLVGCAGIKIDADYDPRADFAALRTYAWLPAPRDRSGDPRLDNPLLAARIEQALDLAVTTKGYAKIEPGRADFFVTFASMFIFCGPWYSRKRRCAFAMSTSPMIFRVYSA